MVSFIAAAGPCWTYTIYSLFTEDHPNFSTAMRTTFRDRMEAGQLLAKQLHEYEHRAYAIVLALPRGGVPVGYEIATKLGLPLDVFVVRKLGVPGQPELAMGAIASAASANSTKISRSSATRRCAIYSRGRRKDGRASFPCEFVGRCCCWFFARAPSLRMMPRRNAASSQMRDSWCSKGNGAVKVI